MMRPPRGWTWLELFVVYAITLLGGLVIGFVMGMLFS